MLLVLENWKATAFHSSFVYALVRQQLASLNIRVADSRGSLFPDLAPQIARLLIPIFPGIQKPARRFCFSFDIIISAGAFVMEEQWKDVFPHQVPSN